MPDVLDRPIQENEFGDILLDEFELRITTQMRDVIDGAGHKVIDPDNFVATSQQQIHEMGAKEASGAGHDGSRSRWRAMGACFAH